MCEQCVRQLKNLGGITKRIKGKANWMAARLMTDTAIPFMDIRTNLAIEVVIHQRVLNNTNKNKYKRVKYRANSGHYYA